MEQQSTRLLATNLFPGISDADLHGEMNRLLTVVDWQHLMFVDGPLRHALLHVVHDPVKPIARCCLRLHLRTGMLHGFSCSGELGNIVKSLPIVAGFVLGASKDELASLEGERQLASILRAAGLGKLSVQFERDGTLLPAPLVGDSLHHKLALFGLNHMRHQRGMAGLDGLPGGLMEMLNTMGSRRCDAVRDFLACLEASALAYCLDDQMTRRGQLDLYNYLVADGGVYCRNRLQAVQALPWLLAALTETIQAPSGLQLRPQDVRWPSCVQRIQRAVDLGEPLVNAIAATLDVPCETVRWLGRRPLPAGWLLDMRRVGLLLRLLSWLPPEQRPKTPAEFERLVTLGNAFLSPFERLSECEPYPDLRRPQYGRIFRQWIGAYQRRHCGGLDAQFDAMQRALADSRDYLAAACGALADGAGPDVDHAARHEWALVTLLDRLCSVSVRRLLAQSQAWHDEVERLQRLERGGEVRGASSMGWSLVLPEPWQHQDVVISELPDADALKAEGRLMRHCVGSYADECAEGNSLVFSLRNPTGMRLSTAQLCLVDGGERLVLVQHRGVRNDAAPQACERAIAALVARLNRPEFAALRVARSQEQGTRRLLGKEASDLSAAQLRWQQGEIALPLFMQTR